MKKSIIYILMTYLLGFIACTEDNSRLGSNFIPDITIDELRDTSIVSYSGNVLEITPSVQTEYAESDLKYAWYIYNTEGTTTDGGELNGYATEKIGDQKTLSYEVNLPSGVYGIIFEVKATAYDYTRTMDMELSVSTSFSRGFYILKETAEGQTELDLVTLDGLSEDILTNRFGAPLSGKPVNLSVVYGQCYIDEETQEMSSTKALHVISEEDYRAFRTEDMVQIHDRNTIFYGEPSVDEKFYGVYHGMLSVYLFTNKGYYGCGAGSEWFGYNSGKFGFPVGTGGSKYAQQLGAGYNGVAFWNGTEHTLCWADYNAMLVASLDYRLPSNMEAATLECISSGLNYVGGNETAWFLVKDASNNRCLLLIENSDKVTDVVEIPNSSRLARADIVAGNALSASIIYFVSENRLYAYSLTGGNEYEIPLPGVEGTLTYISNPFLDLDGFTGGRAENFDSLVVGTETSEGYNLYIFDDMAGGAPQSATEPYQGTGKVKSVHYVPSLQPDCSMVYEMRPFYPWTD